jgi:hypothetical protein
MRIRNRQYRFFLLLLLTGIGSGCTTVKPYQRVYLNDESMQLGKRPIDSFDESIHVYREGSTGGGGGKTSGGCGCN